MVKDLCSKISLIKNCIGLEAQTALVTVAALRWIYTILPALFVNYTISSISAIQIYAIYKVYKTTPKEQVEQ